MRRRPNVADSQFIAGQRCEMQFTNTVFRPPVKSLSLFSSCLALICFWALPWSIAAGTATEASSTRSDPYWCCGLNCLTFLAHFHEVQAPLKSIEEVLKPRPNGECSVADIERAALWLGFVPVSAHLEWNRLQDVPLPCIVQLRSQTRYATGSHFAVLMGLHRDGVVLLDAPNRATLHPYDEFRDDFTGVVIVFPRDESERRDFVDRAVNAASWTHWPIRVAIAVPLACLAWFIRYRPAQGTMNSSATSTGGNA